MLRNIFSPFLFITMIVFLAACGTSKSISAVEKEKLPKVKEEMLIERLDSLYKIKPDFFYTKLSTKYADSTKNHSFTTTVRMRSDSAVQATITFAKIPTFNTMVTLDSITLVDRTDKCFVQEKLDFFKDIFDIDFSYKNIEEILLGLPIDWETDQKYHQIRNQYNYIISPQTKRKIRRLDTGDNGVIIRYFMTDDAKQLEKVIIDSPKDTISIVVEYKEREKIKGYDIPTKADVNIKTKKNNYSISFKYSKTEINEPRILYLTIPSKYERCE